MSLTVDREIHFPEDVKTPMLVVTLPQELIPPAPRNVVLSPDYRPMVKYLVQQLPEDSELRNALKHPKEYAFRGLTRTDDPELLTTTINDIQEYGIDRGGPNGDKTWYAIGYYGLEHAIPKNLSRVGFLIISRRDGMYQKRRSWLNGTAVRPPHTFKSLHIGTIQLRLG